jgi:WD40 repeat protein
MDGSELKVWNTTEGKELGKVQANPAWLAFVQSEKDGEHLLLVQRDLVVLSWRPGSEIRKVCTLEAPERPEARIDIYQLFVSEDGSRVAACWDLRAAGVWALPQGKLIFRWSPGRYSEQLDISLRPDGKRLAILQRYATDKVWDADADRELLSLETAGSLRLSRDGRYLLYSRSPPFDSNRNSRPPPLRIFDLADKSVLFSAKEYAGELALADEALLLAAVRDNVIRIYDPHTGEAIAFRDRGSKKKADYLTLPSGKATAVAFDGSATLLACACDDGAIRLFNPRTGDELAIFETEENWSQVAISPSGNWLAVGNPGGVVRVWDLSLTRQQLRDIGLDWPTTGPD